MLMRIQISLTDSEGHTEMHPIDVAAEMPEMGDRIIDDVEQAVLALNKVTFRAQKPVGPPLLEEIIPTLFVGGKLISPLQNCHDNTSRHGILCKL